MVTIGSQASGDTGLNICTSGLIAALIVGERPHSTPSGTAISGRQQETGEHGLEAGEDLIEKGRLAGIGMDLDLGRRIGGEQFGIALFLTRVEVMRALPLGAVIGIEVFGLLPDLRRPRQRAEARLHPRREDAPQAEEDGERQIGIPSWRHSSLL